jgi:hypothetical protein
MICKGLIQASLQAYTHWGVELLVWGKQFFVLSEEINWSDDSMSL